MCHVSWGVTGMVIHRVVRILNQHDSCLGNHGPIGQREKRSFDHGPYGCVIFREFPLLDGFQGGQRRNYPFDHSPCTPGEHQKRWQMDVHPPQNGAMGFAPWPFLGSPKGDGNYWITPMRTSSRSHLPGPMAHHFGRKSISFPRKMARMGLLDKNNRAGRTSHNLTHFPSRLARKVQLFIYHYNGPNPKSLKKSRNYGSELGKNHSTKCSTWIALHKSNNLLVVSTFGGFLQREPCVLAPNCSHPLHSYKPGMAQDTLPPSPAPLPHAPIPLK